MSKHWLDEIDPELSFDAESSWWKIALDNPGAVIAIGCPFAAIVAAFVWSVGGAIMRAIGL